MLDDVLGKGRDRKVFAMDVLSRIEKLPEEIRDEIRNHPEVKEAFPDL